MKYVEDLPPHVQVVVVIILVIGVLLIPSIVSISDFATSLKTKLCSMVRGCRERKERKLQKELEEREFRQNVNDIMTSIPDIYAKINAVVHDIDAVVTSSKTNSDNNEKFEDILSKMTLELEELSQRSKLNDDELSAHSKTNRDNIKYLIEKVNNLASSVEKVDIKVKLLVDGDIDDFRTFLIQVYNQCIAGDHILSKREISVLKNKYQRYRAEGGNGWAKRLMIEMAEEIGDSELLEICKSNED